MKCDQMPELLISLLYNELDSSQEKTVQKHLKSCAYCRQSFQELQSTTRMLKQWEPEDPRFHHVFITEPEHRWRFVKNRLTGLGWAPKLAIGLSAACISVLFILALFNFTADYKNGDLHVSFSFFKSGNQESAAEMSKLVDARHQETLAAVAELIRESQDQQEQEYDMKLTRLIENFEQKRRQDLMMVGQGLEGMHLSNEGRYYETRSMLNNLIKLANMENTK